MSTPQRAAYSLPDRWEDEISAESGPYDLDPRSLDDPGSPEALEAFAKAFEAELYASPPFREEEGAAHFPAQTGRSSALHDPFAPPSRAGAPSSAYDPWDDAALEQLSKELAAYDALEPPRFEQGVLPPLTAPAPPRRRGGVLPMAVGIAVLMGLGFFGYQYFIAGQGAGLGGPLLVAAPEGPFKIVPEAGDVIEEPAETYAVFAPSGANGETEERLVTRNEEIPDLPAITPQVDRVELSGNDAPASEALPPDTGPRRVRTVLVRPDGTIIEGDGVSSPSSGASSPPSAIAAAIAASDAEDPAPLPVVSAVEPQATPPSLPVAEAPAPESPLPDLPGPSVAEAVSPLPDLPGPPSEQALADGPAAEAPLPELPGPDPAAEGETAALENAPADADAETDIADLITLEAPLPRARPLFSAPREVAAVAQTPVQTRALAANGNSGPLDLAATASRPPPTTSASQATGATFVQLSSQRSEAEARAAFAALQRRHGATLAGLVPDIQRADLGEKGIYYRVRVVQNSREDANALCASLKAAGADCLIARR